VTGNPGWTNRLTVTSNIVHVGSFAVAVAGTIASDGLTTATAFAILSASVGVLLAALVHIPFTDGRISDKLYVIGGVVTFSIAIALSGGLDSAFVIMPIASIFLAAMAGGVGSAVPIAVLSVAGVLLSTWVGDSTTNIEAIIRIPAIYAITAIAFSEVKRALTSETERADDLVTATRAAEGRTERLEATHELLEDLLKVATSPDVNAVATAQEALRNIGVIVPSAPSTIVAIGGVNLARRGVVRDDEASDVIAIARTGIELAYLSMWLDGAQLTPSQREAIRSSVASVGLALENDAMVQRLAGLTIQRERVRLARELHDDIAPSIASVGLALDMVLMADNLTADQHRTLDATRSNVTRLVDRIRGRVQDLRADRSTSIVEMAHSLVAEVDAEGPTVVVDLDERTPPRPAIAAEVGAILTEAFRNALHHADATIITIGGRIDKDSGTITVADNGRGFDRTDPSVDRFGFVGMEERTALIGATLTAESSEGSGTSVSLTWEERS
jgi:signal transduction histidine kinase